MKRSPLKRKTPMKRSAMPNSRTPFPKSRKPLPQSSARRKAEKPLRVQARQEVIERAHGMCEAWGIDGINHDHRTAAIPVERRQVHELTGGSRRGSTYLVPDYCLLLCPAVNEYVSNGSPRESERRGLRLPHWAGDAERLEAARLRAAWRNGETPDPSWFTEDYKSDLTADGRK